MVRSFFTWAVALSTLLVLGCAKDSGPATASVSGTVYLDDKPLEGVEVNFFSQEQSFLASGITDSSGKYALYQGAVAGENKVWITKVQTSDGDPAAMEDDPDTDPGMMEAMSGADTVEEAATESDQLPKKFSDSEETVLKFSVPAGGTSSADFKLTSDKPASE